MTYAIGDIHGCRNALVTLMKVLPLDRHDTVVFLGDYIDRGPDSKGVVDYLLQFKEVYNTVFLRGNHELLLANAATSEKELQYYLQENIGGVETLESYGGALENISEKHWQFLVEETVFYHETETHIFAHGGINARLPMEKQNKRDLLWKRFENLSPHSSGKTLVCGHSIQKKPVMVGGHSICIDTAAAFDGWLTALNIETGTYFQANERSEVSEGSLERSKPSRPGFQTYLSGLQSIFSK